ncbi:MerR family transcriptional regulator [Brevibacterium luteolum]|uniref:MerR family transcriptional regulator n=1 Tax=Brevibacterium luteolum TaxID=199591 RepID=A0A849AQK8_9MICO|nr:DNA-binding transcriptional MerR regulator [Brevibacterium luteolum]NNG78451.1 MerR family transcriptional regulator [Brevibacterium luteolum]
MKLSALAEATGISTASIKYYLRTGLLQPGVKRNQTTAVYHDTHVERLELIAALRQLVGLSIEQISTLTAVIDDPQASMLDVMQTAQLLGGGLPPLTAEPPAAQDARMAAAEARVAAVMEAQGWPDAPSAARAAAASVVAEMTGLGLEVTDKYLQLIGAAVDMISGSDLDISGSRDRMAMYVAVGTHRYSRLVLALLQLGQTSHSIARAGEHTHR